MSLLIHMIIMEGKEMIIQLPYGRSKVEIQLEDDRVLTIMHSKLDEYHPKLSEVELIENALDHPIDSLKLSELAKGKKKVVLICSDHTRPVPSKLMIPLLLKGIREGNKDAEITLLIATGCHRGTTKEELIHKFGEEIVEKEKIVVHDCMDEDNLVRIGTLPSGGTLRINKMVSEADLVISEGFIEPHFFAGFSGGRKSILPGVASRETVYWNHNADFIKDEHARTGILENNPIHEDMIYAARKAKLAFICNVVINSKHEVIGAFAGDAINAHREGAKMVKELCASKPVMADIVITTNNGYPLDQNIYQAVKGMSTAEMTCKEGGVIIMYAQCEDGHGGEEFCRTFQNDKTALEILEEIERTPREDTIADQWQSQIFARILKKHRIIFISDADRELVESLKMIPAHNIEEALDIAKELLGYDGTITVIPEGISTYIEKEYV